MMISSVLILPAELQEAGNQLAIALGYDVPPGNTYNVALSPTGEAPATHYGTHSFVRQAFIDLLTDAAQGKLPDGLDAKLVNPVLGALISSIGSELPPREHFDAALLANGLREIEDGMRGMQ